MPAYHIPCCCMVVMVLSMAPIPSLLCIPDQFPALAAAFKDGEGGEVGEVAAVRSC